MINFKEMKMEIPQIRKKSNGYMIRIRRHRSTLKEARKVQRFMGQFIDSVSIYQNSKGVFVIETNQIFSSLEDAIKCRDFLNVVLKHYEY